MNENEILDVCLEALRNGASLASCIEKYPELDPESKTMLQAAVRLHQAGQRLTPDPTFKHRSRAHLMQRIAAEQAHTAQPAPDWRERLHKRWQTFLQRMQAPRMGLQPLAAMFAIIVVLALGGGVVAAAQKSLPGTSLYPVKRIAEQVRTTLIGDDITWRMDLAQRRLDEAVTMAETDVDNLEAVDALLADYSDIMHDVANIIEQQLTTGAELRSRDEIYQRVVTQIEQLRPLQEKSSNYEQAMRAAIALTDLLIPTLKNAIPAPTTLPTTTPEVPPSSVPGTSWPTPAGTSTSIPASPTPHPVDTPAMGDMPQPPSPPPSPDSNGMTQQPHPSPTIVPPAPTVAIPTIDMPKPSPTIPKTPSFSP